MSNTEIDLQAVRVQAEQAQKAAEALRIVDFNERKQEFFCRACRYRDPLIDGNKLHDDNCPWVEYVHEFKKLLDGLSQLTAREPQGWQPIETAPKDGTWILAYGIDGSLQRVSWGQTRNDGLQWCTVHGWAHFRYVTHWMPLPSPPIIRSPSSPPSGEQG